MKNKIYASMLILLTASPLAAFAEIKCTEPVQIAGLYPRAGGWVHIAAKGVTNIDLLGCGENNGLGLLLNYNSTGGTLDGKKMLYAALLKALTTGSTLVLCSTVCDSQHPSYSTLDVINDLK